MVNTSPRNVSIFWIVLSFIVWVFIFWGFLSLRLTIFEDAPSYYEHTKFFIENLAKGIFPLWDPFWFNGAPNDFFLRRIGSFNPFYLVISLFEFFKIPYALAYLWFLALYYWGGMIAFYLLAMRIYDNRLIAYAGYLMLLFSSLGTRLFDSYMMIVTVPLIWFFYFLIAFFKTPARRLFLGMCLSFIILSSTYIPLYFLSLLAVFVIFFSLFYFKQIPEITRRYLGFFKDNRMLVILSLGFILLSFVPAVTFFHNSNNGQIVLPARHGSAQSGGALSVPSKTLDWGAVEDLAFSSYFSDWRTIRFAVIYIPFFAFIIFALGMFGRITRRAAFMFTFGFIFLCCLIPHGLPFYDFLYKHIFFLKYFRNLHFFLWFALIPLFVLLVLEHWKIFSEFKPTEFLSKKKLLIYVLSIHFLALFFVILRGDAIVSAYCMLILSAVFWSLMLEDRLSSRPFAFAILSLTIIVQPLEVYHYLLANSKPYRGSYGYGFSYTTLTFKQPEKTLQSMSPVNKGGSLYYASGSYNSIFNNITNYALAKYVQNTFVLVDHLQVMDRNQVNFSVLEKSFLANENRAFVFQGKGAVLKTEGNNPNPSVNAQRVDGQTQAFKVLTFNANYLKLAINVPYEKFFVYNDSYDPQWTVTVNGQKTALYQTNVAFKGVWIPSGSSIVEFYYGSWWQYVMNWTLFVGNFIFLIGIVWFSRKFFL